VPSYRSTASFGRRQEFVVMGELLRRGFDVYQTLVDDQGIDCIIRQQKGGTIRYLELQIKARSRDCSPRNAGRFVPIKIPRVDQHYYFIFYSEQADCFWVVSSLQMVKEALRNKTGANAGKYSINFCNARADGKVVPRPRFDRYKGRFDTLLWSE